MSPASRTAGLGKQSLYVRACRKENVGQKTLDEFAQVVKQSARSLISYYN